MSQLIVAKVGGSLFSWPGLRAALVSFLSNNANSRWLLVPGGGATAQVVRNWDIQHLLGDEKSHWLALAAMTLNAHLLSHLISEASVVSEPPKHGSGVTILNALAFCRGDDADSNRVAHTWRATSDAVAARVAEKYRADVFVVLKSAAPPAGNLTDCAKAGYIDEETPNICERSRLPVMFVDLTTWKNQPDWKVLTTSPTSLAESP